jgi:hypothetical protein
MQPTGAERRAPSSLSDVLSGAPLQRTHLRPAKTSHYWFWPVSPSTSDRPSAWIPGLSNEVLRSERTWQTASAPEFRGAASTASGQYESQQRAAYRAAAAGQRLTVTWKMTCGSGNVALNGAAVH